MEAFFENRPVNFAQFRGGGGILDADDDAVGMKKISDGGAFAEKFGVRSDAEFDIAVLGVGGERAAEFEAGARGDGAFFNDEFGGARLGGNLAGDVVDRG